MAEKFLQNGDCVAVLDLENDNLRELKKEYPGRLFDCICDMRDAGGVVETVNRIAASFRPSILRSIMPAGVPLIPWPTRLMRFIRKCLT